MITSNPLIGPKMKNDNKSKLGVHDPDLNCPDTLIKIIEVTKTK